MSLLQLLIRGDKGSTTAGHATRAARGTFWNALGTGLNQVSSIGSSILIARILNEQGYGQLGAVQATVAMMVEFAALGVDYAANHFFAEWRYRSVAHIRRLISLSRGIVFIGIGLLSGATLLLGRPMSILVSNGPGLATALRLSCLWLASLTLYRYYKAVFSGLEQFRGLAGIDVMRAILQVVLPAAGAYSWGVEGATIGFGLCGCATVVLFEANLRVVLRGMPAQATPCSEGDERATILGRLFRFSGPVVISGLITASTVWYCNTVLVRSSGFLEMALFSVGAQWRNAILFVPTMSGMAVLAILTQLRKEGDKGTFDSIMRWYLIITIAVAMVEGAAIMVLAPNIMRSYGSGFAPYQRILVVNVATAVVQTAAWVYSRAILSAGKTSIGLVANVAWAGVLAIIFANSEPTALGLSYAYVLSYLFQLVVFAAAHRLLLRGRVAGWP